MKRLPVLAVALLAVITVTAAAPASRSHRSTTCPPLLPLTANSIGPASAAALRSTHPSERPQVVSAGRAADRSRGPEAKFVCGVRVWRRTVVVYITLRAFLPSASLSERVDFVGRFRNGYRVWRVVH
jgi:hypothetical protein